MNKILVSTWAGAILENGLDHGTDLVLSNGSHSLQPLGGEELERAHLPHLHIVRTEIGPDQVLAVPAKLGRRPAPRSVGQLLVVFLEHLLGQRRARHHHVQRRPEPHRHDRAVGARPVGEAPEPHRLDVVEVAHHRPWAWTGW